MADKMTPAQRHRCMSHIRSNDTKPEMIVRKWLWREGFRYRLHMKSLPGTPDIVLRKIKTVIFINGCFWHGHIAGECFRPPKSNIIFWETKILKNKERDALNHMRLKSQGWTVIVVWECQLSKKNRTQTLQALSVKLSKLILEKHTVKPNYYYGEEESQQSIAAENVSPYNKQT